MKVWNVEQKKKKKKLRTSSRNCSNCCHHLFNPFLPFHSYPVIDDSPPPLLFRTLFPITEHTMMLIIIQHTERHTEFLIRCSKTRSCILYAILFFAAVLLSPSSRAFFSSFLFHCILIFVFSLCLSCITTCHSLGVV